MQVDTYQLTCCVDCIFNCVIGNDFLFVSKIL